MAELHVALSLDCSQFDIESIVAALVEMHTHTIEAEFELQTTVNCTMKTFVIIKRVSWKPVGW